MKKLVKVSMLVGLSIIGLNIYSINSFAEEIPSNEVDKSILSEQENSQIQAVTDSEISTSTIQDDSYELEKQKALDAGYTL
ncbi:hypothetical protein [Enterococcus alishanensis]